MARLMSIEKDRATLVEGLRRAVQSAHLNCVIGSGCSRPALEPLGNIEAAVRSLRSSGEHEKAQRQLFSFIEPFLDVTVRMLAGKDKSIDTTLASYKAFLTVLSGIMFERKSSILPKQASIFSTNYDLFVERASEEVNTIARLNDGFMRLPRLSGGFEFSTSEFFNAAENDGNIYNYKVRIPSLNLIKLHGSLSWEVSGEKIIFSTGRFPALLEDWRAVHARGDPKEIADFSERLAIVW
ncbi:MAG: hypothetical protein AAB152_05665 [Candidatus Coatesbacteria bacterium]